jgi:hypothetical protein
MKHQHKHGKAAHNASGGIGGLGMDHHHRGKHGASGGGKPHNKVGKAGGSRTRSTGKPPAMGATTDQKGSRPIRLAASKARRPTVSKRKKISHDTLI